MAQSATWAAPSTLVLAPPQAGRITRRWLIRIGLTAAFFVCFFQFEFQSNIMQYLSLVVLGACGLLVLCGRRRTERLQHILGGGGLLFGAVLFSECISYVSGDPYSYAYGLAFLGVILCFRLILQEVGVIAVIRAYSQAGVLTIALIAISGRRLLLGGGQYRFAGGTRAHPNLVSFILGGYLPVLIWRALEETVPWRRRALFVLCLVAAFMTFLTGSRGTLLAVLITGLVLGLRGLAAGAWIKKFRVQHYHIVFVLLLIPLSVWFMVHNNRIGHILSYLNDFLSLSSSQRGVKSGLSGRTVFWFRAFFLLRLFQRWLLGFGFRAGDRMVGTIDNGYVQLLFDNGLIAGSIVIGCLLRILVLFWRASRMHVNNAWTRYYTVLWCMIIIYLTNNISTRYLFSFGSPFSLCVLCLMATSRDELLPGGVRKQAKKPKSQDRSLPVKDRAWRNPLRS